MNEGQIMTQTQRNEDHIEIPPDHPRYQSLLLREKVIEGYKRHIVALAGLVAHGRGEAFDYLIGEKTPKWALEQEKAAVALLLLAEHPIISVNGNVAALCPEAVVEFSKTVNAPLEVNLFYRTRQREEAIKSALLDAGATEVLGADPEHQVKIRELSHARRIVDSRGIYRADVVLVPLEDGDRTQALRLLGKKVIAIDLNPLSRTALAAHITIVNNIIRALPEMTQFAQKLRDQPKEELERLVKSYDNKKLLKKAIKGMTAQLPTLFEEKFAEVSRLFQR